jgi:alpha-mannosidase
MTQPLPRFILHLVPNAHLDPVWLWDWREGFTEMIATTRTVLDLMDEIPDLTFMRGEAFFYRHVEQNDPAAFRRIQAYVEAGRWDVVGGNMLQTDMNLPATETFVRQVLYGQRYFQERFGRPARAAWSADCFGHSIGLPDLLAAAGMEYYAYTRPFGYPAHTTFWWQGPAGGRILVHHARYGGYVTERHETVARLDGLLQQAQSEPYRNILGFMGMGDHGGYPTRRQIADVRAWAQAHPEIQVRFSTFTGYGDALRAEMAQMEAPTAALVEGELNFAPRGVYAANARFKFAYRKAEAGVLRAERLAAGIAAAEEKQVIDLREPWEAVLFNTFHDILPGSSIERAYDEQLDWLGSAAHAVRRVEQRALHRLAEKIDTRTRPALADMPAGVPMLLFNPHPWPYEGAVELETNLDYRPLWKYSAAPETAPVSVTDPQLGRLPHQRIALEEIYMTNVNFRTRVLAPVTVPAFGWKVLEYAYDEQAGLVQASGSAGGALDGSRARIWNATWEVSAAPGERGVTLKRDGQPVLDAPGLNAVLVEDPWGPWGDFDDSPPSLDLQEVREAWTVTRVEVDETGPLRATLHVRLQNKRLEGAHSQSEYGHSRMDLRFSLLHGRDAVDVSARVLWDERCARLKLQLPGGFTSAVYDVMGGCVERGAVGEVPGGRWVQLNGPDHALGFASDALYGFNLASSGALQATVVRASRFTHEGRATVEQFPWYPVMDCGELRFQFLLTCDPQRLPRLATELEQPVLVAQALPSAGEWPAAGSWMHLEPEQAQLLALKPAEEGDGWILRVQGLPGGAVTPQLTWHGQAIAIATLQPGQIQTYRLVQSGGAWQARPVSLLEEDI